MQVFPYLCILTYEKYRKRVNEVNIFGNNREQHILRLFRRQDRRAMDMLYAEYASTLTAIGARYIADDDDLHDVLQEAFIKVLTGIGHFEYRGKGSLRAWLTRIVVNESLLFLRQKKKQQMEIPDSKLAGNEGLQNIADLPDDSPDPEGLTPDELGVVLRQLPEGYRAVLNLYVIEGMSHKEIGRLLGIKPDTSASQLHRAKKMLARIIKDYKKSKP